MRCSRLCSAMFASTGEGTLPHRSARCQLQLLVGRTAHRCGLIRVSLLALWSLCQPLGAPAAPQGPSPRSLSQRSQTQLCVPYAARGTRRSTFSQRPRSASQPCCGGMISGGQGGPPGARRPCAGCARSSGSPPPSTSASKQLSGRSPTPPRTAPVAGTGTPRAGHRLAALPSR
jgi:hypothetical protein